MNQRFLFIVVAASAFYISQVNTADDYFLRYITFYDVAKKLDVDNKEAAACFIRFEELVDDFLKFYICDMNTAPSIITNTFGFSPNLKSQGRSAVTELKEIAETVVDYKEKLRDALENHEALKLGGLINKTEANTKQKYIIFLDNMNYLRSHTHREEARKIITLIKIKNKLLKEKMENYIYDFQECYKNKWKFHY